MLPTSELIDPFRAQHLSVARACVETPEGPADVAIDELESPLAWLARRKGRDGAAADSAGAVSGGRTAARPISRAPT